MKKILAGLLLTFLSFSLPAEETKSPINRPVFGVNLAGYADWVPTIPFNDLMKQSRPWIYDYSKDENAEKPEMDRMGNWKPVAGKKPFAMLASSRTKCPAGLYVITWEGKGKIGLNGLAAKDGKVKKEESNRLEVEFTDAPNIVLQILECDEKNPVRNLHCFLPGTEKDPSHFNKLYYKDYHGMFSTIRFMDWMETNSSEQEKWENRPVPEQQSFRKSQGHGGVPVEYMVEFANLTHANPWFCMPHKADDEYVRNFAKIVKEKLDPKLKAYIEYSNEIWNTAPAFQQTAYAVTKATELGLTTDSKAPYAAWYGKRSVEIFKIWEEVFGGKDRLVRVCAGWAIGADRCKPKLDAYELGKNCDALAIAPYAGFNADVKKDLDTTKPDPAAVIAATEQQITEKMSKRVAEIAALAKEYNIRLIAYEGGINYTAPRKLQNDKNVEAFIGTISRDPKIEECMEKYLRAWYSNAGDLMCLFSDYGAPSKYGTYGNLGEFPGQPDSEAPKRRAILKAIKDPALLLKK